MLQLFSKNSCEEQMKALKLAANMFLASSSERCDLPTAFPLNEVVHKCWPAFEMLLEISQLTILRSCNHLSFDRRRPGMNRVYNDDFFSVYCLWWPLSLLLVTAEMIANSNRPLQMIFQVILNHIFTCYLKLSSWKGRHEIY